MHDGAAFDFYVQRDRLTFVDQRDRQGFAQPRRIWAELNCPIGLGNLKLLLQGGNRHHSTGRSRDAAESLRAPCAGRHEPDARDDLQAVCDPVLHLVRRQVLPLQKLCQPAPPLSAARSAPVAAEARRGSTGHRPARKPGDLEHLHERVRTSDRKSRLP